MMVCIDVMALSVALDVIVFEFQTPIYQTQWLFTAYMIANSAFLIAAGHFADLYGIRRFLLFGILGFTAASAIAACSYNFWLLVVARGFQGIAGAVIMTTSIALITSNFSLIERSQILSRWIFSVGLGLAFGPIVGGIIVHMINWRLIFIINLPIGIVVYFLVKKYLPDSKIDNSTEKPGVLNAILLSLTIAILAAILTEGPELGWQSKPLFMAYISFISSSILFLHYEMKGDHSIIDFRLYSQSSFIIGVFSGFFSYFFMYAWLFIFSLYLQDVRGLSPLTASFVCISYSIAFAFSPLIFDKFFSNLDGVDFIRAGFVGVILSFVGMSINPMFAPLSLLMLTFFLLGLSIALINVSSMLMATRSAAKSMAGSISGAIFTVRWLGGAIGVVIATIIYHTTASFTQSAMLASGIKPSLSLGLTVTFMTLATLSLLCFLLVSIYAHKIKLTDIK